MITRCTTCSAGVTSLGCAASSKRRGMGSDRTHPAPPATEGDQLVVAAVAAAQPQQAVRQDAALEEGVELLLDESGQLGARAGFGLRNEAGRVLLHQAEQPSLLGAMAFVVNRGAIRCPLGLPADGLHDGLPRW